MITLLTLLLRMMRMASLSCLLHPSNSLGGLDEGGEDVVPLDDEGHEGHLSTLLPWLKPCRSYRRR